MRNYKYSLIVNLNQIKIILKVFDNVKGEFLPTKKFFGYLEMTKISNFIWDFN